MVDTIVLMLSNDSFQITDPTLFTPMAHWANDPQPRWGMISKQNPTKNELRAGVYKPHLTLTNKPDKQAKNNVFLKIELSLPKLMYGNNFDELARKDFKALLTKLATTLETMGVVVTPTALAKAPVAAIHYSKNIPLTDGSIPFQYINKIKEANVQLSLDVNQTDYRNGHSFKWHCNSYEIVFYDKIKDLENSKYSSKRALESDNEIQMDLFDRLQRRRKLEFLRMEVRLKRKKLKQLFPKLGIKSNLTLDSLFKVATARKVLLHYLDEIESKRPAIMDYRATSDEAFLAAIKFNNPKIGPMKMMQVFGLKKALETMEMRELRAMFDKNSSASWYRLIADTKKMHLPIGQRSFGIIRASLSKFSNLKMNKF